VRSNLDSDGENVGCVLVAAVLRKRDGFSVGNAVRGQIKLNRGRSESLGSLRGFVLTVDIRQLKASEPAGLVEIKTAKIGALLMLKSPQRGCVSVAEPIKLRSVFSAKNAGTEAERRALWGVRLAGKRLRHC
jgi:hypothetical protein